MAHKKTSSSRRTFLKTMTAGAAGGVLGGGVFASGMTSKSYGRILGANDRVRVGVVGFSSRARGSLIPAFLASAKDMNFDIVAVSDIWNRRREEGAAFVDAQRAEAGMEAGDGVKAMRNNEELYECGDHFHSGFSACASCHRSRRGRVRRIC